MRVSVNFAASGERPAHAIKVKLPKSWVEKGSVGQILDLFLESYNAKFPAPDLSLAADAVALLSQGQVLPPQGPIKVNVKEHDELTVSLAAALGGAKAAPAAAGGPPGSVLCRNYGCAKRFLPSENGPEACSHHVAPPIFREIQKSWSCCPDKTAWDWEGFQALPTCAKGPHSAEPPAGPSFAASPTVALASSSASSGSVVRSIDDFNRRNPDAVTAASAAVASSTAARTTAVRREDGRVRCVHFGCQKFYDEGTENDDGACLHHRGGPNFHEGFKFWSCCPQTRCMEFDAFLAVPGCVKSRHASTSEAAAALVASSAATGASAGSAVGARAPAAAKGTTAGDDDSD